MFPKAYKKNDNKLNSAFQWSTKTGCVTLFLPQIIGKRERESVILNNNKNVGRGPVEKIYSSKKFSSTFVYASRHQDYCLRNAKIKRIVSLLGYVCTIVRYFYSVAIQLLALNSHLLLSRWPTYVYPNFRIIEETTLIFKFNEKWDMPHRWKVSSSVMKITENFIPTFVENYYRIAAIFTRFISKSSKWCLHPFRLSQVISKNIYTMTNIKMYIQFMLYKI